MTQDVRGREIRDADALASELKPGSIDKLHRRLAKATTDFALSNLDGDQPIVMAVLATHVLDLLLQTARTLGGATEPGSFQTWMASVAGAIERGEHLRGDLQ